VKKDKSDRAVVLISEDDPDDQYLFRSAFLEIDKQLKVRNVLTGRQLIDFLLQTSVFAEDQNRQLPRFIVADLKRPFFELEIIREIRIYTQFRLIPIFLFSMDNSIALRTQALNLGVTAFYKKPSTYSDLKNIAREIINSNALKAAT
jgi:two-component system, response regulator